MRDNGIGKEDARKRGGGGGGGGALTVDYSKKTQLRYTDIIVSR